MQGAPYYFRYNPVAARWVCVGPQLPESRIRLPEPPKRGKAPVFESVQYPGNVFVIEPPTGTKQPPEMLLYKEQPPVGEYFSMIYRGEKSPSSWNASIWQQWIDAVQYRLIQFYHNPYLHNVQVQFPLECMIIHDEALKVGTLIATSHPISQTLPTIEHDLARKLRSKEKTFIALETERLTAFVASAPQNDREIWIIPHNGGSCFEGSSPVVIKDLSKILANLIPTLHDEYPQQTFVLEIITSLLHEDDRSWWIRLYDSSPPKYNRGVPVREYPEALLHRLKLVLKG